SAAAAGSSLGRLTRRCVSTCVMASFWLCCDWFNAESRLVLIRSLVMRVNMACSLIALRLLTAHLNGDLGELVDRRHHARGRLVRILKLLQLHAFLVERNARERRALVLQLRQHQLRRLLLRVHPLQHPTD